ncbi:hypothetical protein BU15DRAFT_68389 [Melanogaster broomeanus]|nr:hypothetical protein BU15DRAFT_68389 [Melanogaster broomeanus]
MALSPVYIVGGAGACFDSLSDIFSYQNRSLLVGGCMGSRRALVRHTLDDITVGFLLTTSLRGYTFLSAAAMLSHTAQGRADEHTVLYHPNYPRKFLPQKTHLPRRGVVCSVLDHTDRGESLAVCDRPKLGACPRVVRKSILFGEHADIYISIHNVLVAVGALFHTLGQVLDIYLVMIAGGNVEITVTLIVCNLLVVVTYTYRFLLRDSTNSSSTEEHTTDDTSASGPQDEDFTRPTRQRRMTTLILTTVNLSLSSGYQDECEISQNGLQSIVVSLKEALFTDAQRVAPHVFPGWDIDRSGSSLYQQGDD